MGKGPPTPEQRARVLVRNLEEAIRENRGVAGMSLRRWQDIARDDITKAIAVAERRAVGDNKVVNRLLMTSGASLITLGFLGGASALGRLDQTLAAAGAMLVGILLLAVGFEWIGRRGVGRWQDQKRNRKLIILDTLDREIRELERQLEAKRDRLRDEVKEAG